MAEKRTRRSKKEIALAKIEAIDQKIADLQEKISGLEAQKDEIQAEIDALDAAAAKAVEEEALKEVLAIMKEKGLSAADLKTAIENKE
ncbi:MAG: hypothetical protein LUH14_04840 [Clostridiaceae bacterium]|nr:hypothetical protein [Clostridiaceae bacterium]